jgi:hypothetical protein
MAGPLHEAIHETPVRAGFCHFEITVISPGAVQGILGEVLQGADGQKRTLEQANRIQKRPERRRRRLRTMRVNHPPRRVSAPVAIGSDTSAFLKNTLSLNKCFFSWTWLPRD